MELKTLKLICLSVACIIYFITFWIIPTILQDADRYSKLYKTIKNDLTDTIYGDPLTKTDAYIINTYYYPKSKSLGENAIAMVLMMNHNTMRDITKYKMQVVASNESGSSVTVVPRLVKEVYSNCPYISIVAHANGIENMEKLEIVEGDTRMEIPFRAPRSSAPAPFIICVSPQFVAEQWQLFVAHAHIAHHFGGHLHFYVISMLESYFNLVKEYEKLGYVTIDFWMRYKFLNSTLEGSPEPNANVEWRNQAGAHTDCLLQYKEAASFITFVDLDDILVPRGFNSYYEEFAHLFYFHPNIITFQYPKKDIMLYNKPIIRDINLVEQFSHPWFGTRDAMGKIVARPKDLDSMWIHFSFNIPEHKMKVVNHNFLLHLQRPIDTNGQDPITYDMKTFAIFKNLKLNESVLEPVQKDLENVLKSESFRDVASKLPTQSYYFPIVFRCYYEKFYKTMFNTCPNGEECLYPQRSDLPCIHSDADYKSGPQMNPITFHYHTEPRWSRDIGCYT